MKTRALAPDEPTPSSRESIDLSDGLEETNKDVLPRNPSAPDDPTHYQCIALEQFCQRTSTAK
jgi:hypothetical protein